MLMSERKGSPAVRRGRGDVAAMTQVQPESKATID